MCGIAGLIARSGEKENGSRIRKGIVLQEERGNGLGAGYAVYGAYPKCRDYYALHVMAEEASSFQEVKELLEGSFRVVHQFDLPLWEGKIKDHPRFRVFFVEPHLSQAEGMDWDEYTLGKVFEVNTRISGAYIYSSGKNVGVFKGVGTPGDIYDFFRLDEYEGYLWMAHNRFPTNTPGWWGGAHPFNLLNYSIVHNGEISSYGINRRYLKTFGYECNMQTDSEVVAYLLDLLIRRHGLSVEEAITALAPPYWSTIERENNEERRNRLRNLKMVYESAMLNGPFAVLAAFEGGMFTLTDNTKLRPMAVAHKDDYSYFASEVSALFEMDEDITRVETPRAGHPCVVKWNEKETKNETGEKNRLGAQV